MDSWYSPRYLISFNTTRLRVVTEMSHLAHPAVFFTQIFFRFLYHCIQFTAQQTVEAGWVSHHKADLELLWISPDGEKILSGNVLFGETNSFWITTRLGHVFEAYDPILDVVVQTFIIRHHSFFVVGKLESRTFEMDVTREVEDTFKTEWHRSRAVKRTFTDLGFHLGKLPLDLWSSMSSYHYNNRNNKALEEWDSKGDVNFLSGCFF